MTRGLLYLFVLLASTASAQQLTARASQPKIMIGERVQLVYKVRTTIGDSIQFEPQSGTLNARLTNGQGALSNSGGAEFEIVEDFTVQKRTKGDSLDWTGTYTLTAWDSGWFLLPGPRIVIDDSTYHFDDVRIGCFLMAPEDGVDLYDIRENFAEVPPNPFSLTAFLKQHWWWIALIVVAAAAFFLIRWFRRRRTGEDEEDQRPMSLKERTLLAIDALEKAKMWEKDLLKEHFVELSYILRSYLTARYNISLLEKTTYETTLILTQKGLEKETVAVIVRILSQSDMVKFAQSKPDVVAILRVSTEARQVVAETSPLEFDNVE